MKSTLPKYFMDLSQTAQVEVETVSEKVVNLVLKENLSYKEAMTALELAQDSIKEHKLI